MANRQFPATGHPNPDNKEHAVKHLPVLLMFAVIPVGAAAGEAQDTADARVVKLFGNLANFTALARAEKVQAFRVKHTIENARDKQRKQIRGYPVLSGPHPVDKKVAGNLVRLLQDKSTYDFERDKGCEMVPGVVVVFTHQRTKVELVLCFECDQLEIYVGDKNTGYEDFDPARPKLLKLVKRIFPKDQAIQGLKPVPR